MRMCYTHYKHFLNLFALSFHKIHQELMGKPWNWACFVSLILNQQQHMSDTRSSESTLNTHMPHCPVLFPLWPSQEITQRLQGNCPQQGHIMWLWYVVWSINMSSLTRAWNVLAWPPQFVPHLHVSSAGEEYPLGGNDLFTIVNP